MTYNINDLWHRYQKVVSEYNFFNFEQDLWIETFDDKIIKKVKFIKLLPLTYEEFVKLKHPPCEEYDMTRWIGFCVKYEDDNVVTYRLNDRMRYYLAFNEFVSDELFSLDRIENGTDDHSLKITNPSIFYLKDYPFTIEEVNKALRKRIYKRVMNLDVLDFYYIPFGSYISFCRVSNGFVLSDDFLNHGDGSPFMIILESDLESEIEKMDIVNGIFR